MPKAYCLGGNQLIEEMAKMPWVSFPENLVEILAIFDGRDHPRHLRGYASRGNSKQLLGPRAFDADAVLALITVARRHGDSYDLTSGFEIKLAYAIDAGEYQAAYQTIREHVLEVIKVRLAAHDPQGARLDKLCKDVPEQLADVKPEHEPCFAEFDAWHHVAVLRDLAGQALPRIEAERLR